MIERQELHCHNCQNYVQFDVDTEENGNLVLECPVCGHEHCRIIEDGKITDRRWDQRNGRTYNYGAIKASAYATIQTTNVSWTAQSTFTTYNNSSATTPTGTSNDTIARLYLYGSWGNSLTNSSGIITTNII